MNLQTTQILPGLHYLGANDRETEFFENMWPLPQGVAYNAYLIQDEKTCLIDTVRINKANGFLETLTDLLDGRPLDYLIIQHMEPDHAGALGLVLDRYPQLTLVGNKKTGDMLGDYLGIGLDNFLQVATGDQLDLGSRQLTFIQTPMVHWPESMVTYDAQNRVLFSQDIFGGFGTVDGGIFDDQVDYDRRVDEYRRYYTNIVGKYSMMARKALAALADLEIDIICPVHGYVWRQNPQRIIEDYRRWAHYEVQEGVLIAYASMYGNTEQMADLLARYLAEEGLANIEVRDVSKTHPSYILAHAWEKKGLVLGSCTYNNSALPTMNALCHILEMNRLENHVIGVFGSYGWSGGGRKFLQDFAQRGKFEVCESLVEAKGSLKEKDAQDLKKLAQELAEKIRA